MSDTTPYLSYYLNTMDIKFWVRRHLPPPSEPALESPNIQVTHPIEKPELSPTLSMSPPAIVETTQSEAMPTSIQTSHLPPLHLQVQAWQDLQHHVEACTACELYKTRNRPVFGTGSRSATWMFIGEAPGADEDAQGEPFVGRAGKLLTNMLLAIELHRESVYIANILKCRPPSNRTPQPHEVHGCTPFLTQQIALIKPAIIVALGAVAARFLLNTEVEIGKLRGQRFTYANTGIPLIATYHPAYLLRNPVAKSKSWQDLQLACRIIDENQLL
jgi:uracil-DNA glycosylase